MSKTLAPSQKVTHRDPQGLKFMSIVEAAYDKAGLSMGDEAQRVNDTPGLADLIGNFIAENRQPNRFKNEEGSSNYGYLSGYRKPAEVESQIDILRSRWPQLNPDPAIRYVREVYPTLQFPNWVEGPFALIRPGFFSGIYGEELEEVLKAIAKARDGKFCNYRVGKLGPEYLRQSEKTIAMMNLIVKQQPASDILIVPEQFGIRHRGRSVRRVREVIVSPEFGEGAKNVGTMILTNPIRLQDFDDLWIDCSGDEYSPDADGQFDCAPYFYFYDGKVEFLTYWVSDAFEYYGSASGFVSQ